MHGKKNVWQLYCPKRLYTDSYYVRTVLMSTVEFFWNNFLIRGECYMNIHSCDFSRLFCYLSNTRAQCLFSEQSCSSVVWFDVYGSFRSHELTFSVMHQLCNTPVFLLWRWRFLMQLSSCNCNFSVLGGEKNCSQREGLFLNLVS